MVADWREQGYGEMLALRAVPTLVNRQPAAAYCDWDKTEGAWLPLTIDVVRICGGEVTEVYIFSADLFPTLGLAARLTADGMVQS